MNNLNEILEALKGDEWGKVDPSLLTLNEWVNFAALLQTCKKLTKVERVFTSGRISVILNRAGLCDRSRFNELIESANGTNLAKHYTTMLNEPAIEITTFPDDTSATISKRVELELKWREIL